jgi:hypothetical protein
MRQWATKISDLDENKVKFGIVAANNHYAGFGPATANSFRNMMGLNEAVLEEMKQKRWLSKYGAN